MSVEVLHDTWMYTWPEIEQLIGQRASVCTLQGYILSSKDRRCETRADLSAAFGAWSKDVMYAAAGGKVVPPRVIEYHKQLNGVKPEEVLISNALVLETPEIQAPKFTWSYSALTAFENCPLSSAHTRYYKDVPWIETEELRWGNRVHTALENVLKRNSMTSDELLVAPYKKYTDYMLAAGGELHAELELALSEDLKPCDWFDARAWGRCKIDVTILKDGTAHVFDWKTGKVKNDNLQLIVCFIFLAIHFPEIQNFNGKFVWLKHDKVTGLDAPLSRAELLPYMQDLITRVQQFRTAWDNEHFPARPSGLCGWCGYRDRCQYKR